MKTIELSKTHITLEELLEIAGDEIIIISNSLNRKFVVAPVDEFDLEVESLRKNREFMEYLDTISAMEATIPIEDLEKKLDL